MTVSVKYLAQGKYGVLDSKRGLWRWIFPTYLDADKNKFRAINDRNGNFLKGAKLNRALTQIGITKSLIVKRSSTVRDIPNLLELD